MVAWIRSQSEFLVDFGVISTPRYLKGIAEGGPGRPTLVGTERKNIMFWRGNFILLLSAQLSRKSI